MNSFDLDLFVLAADNHMVSALKGLLTRPQGIGCRPIRSEVRRHPNSDSGCFNQSHDFLRPFLRQFARALVIFDKEFDLSKELRGKSRTELQGIVTKNLSINGWQERAKAIVVDPELENWVWTKSPQVELCLGWHGREPRLRDWLRSTGLWPETHTKPADPKEAFLRAIRESRKSLSARIFHELAETVDFGGCEDPAFQELVTTLRNWFPSD